MRDLLREVLLHVGATVKDEGPALVASLPAAPEAAPAEAPVAPAEAGTEAGTEPPAPEPSPEDAPPSDHGPGAELARALGQRDLRLVFESSQLAPGSDLVAPGSHILRVVDELLARRGTRTYVERPAEHRLTLAAVKALVEPSRGLRMSLTDRRPDAGWDVWVVYRLRYHTRERTDRLDTLRVTLRPGAAPRVEPDEPPPGFEAWPAPPRKRAPDALLGPGLAAADALATERARDAAVEIGTEARRKLQRDVGRLQAYFSAQVAELTRGTRRREGAELKIEELEEEHELRLRELSAAAEVRVEIEALQLLTVEVPLTRAQLVLRPSSRKAGVREEAEEDEASAASGDPAAPEALPGLEVVLDRSSGELTLAPCQACGESLVGGTLGVCRGEHVTHVACVRPCAVCHLPTCAACEPVACATCKRQLCPECRIECPDCHQPTCAEHQTACAVCGQGGCARCFPACAHCQARVCAEHRHAAAEGVEASFCVRCAQPCAACGTATPEPEQVRCAVCGRRFCRACHPPDAAACRLCAPRS